MGYVNPFWHFTELCDNPEQATQQERALTYQPKTASAIVHKKGVAMTSDKDTYRIRPKKRQNANPQISSNAPQSTQYALNAS